MLTLLHLNICMCFKVVLRGVWVEACLAEEEVCDPNNPDCCEGLACLEVSPGVYKCEPEACEDHEGHACEPGVRECCDPLVCLEVSSGVFQCEPEACEDHEGHSCEPGVRECCEGLNCVAVDAEGNYKCQVA